MKNVVARILLAILLIGLTLFFSFAAILIFSLDGDGKFYTPYVFIVTILFIAWLISLIFQKLKLKSLIYSMAALIFLSAAAASIYEYRKDYIAKIPVIDDQGVNLWEYEPFGKESKVALLNEESTLSISEDLPVIDGATALYPLYAAFVRATYPPDSYDPYNGIVSSHTTPDAYMNLLSGKADIIFCAAPSKSQLHYADSLGKQFNMTPIGKEAFVFFVNMENPVSGLTVSQIQDIYSGKITNWKQVGGKDEKIRAFQRPENSGSQTMLQKIMGDTQLTEPLTEDFVAGMGGIIEETARYKNFNNALGFSFLFFTTEMVGNNQIKLLKINDIYPDKKAVSSGEYPFTGDLYAITTGKGENKNIKSFIEWILSPQGQYLVDKTGYIPLYN